MTDQVGCVRRPPYNHDIRVIPVQLPIENPPKIIYRSYQGRSSILPRFDETHSEGKSVSLKCRPHLMTVQIEIYEKFQVPETFQSHPLTFRFTMVFWEAFSKSGSCSKQSYKQARSVTQKPSPREYLFGIDKLQILTRTKQFNKRNLDVIIFGLLIVRCLSQRAITA